MATSVQEAEYRVQPHETAADLFQPQVKGPFGWKAVGPECQPGGCWWSRDQAERILRTATRPAIRRPRSRA